jgi:hypothetical protein
MLDVGAIAKGNAYDAGDDMEEDADPTPKSMKGKNRVSDDVISVKSPQTTKGKKKATESNPWMQQQEEDDEPVSKGKMAHKAAAKKAAATKKKNSNAESDEDNDSDEGNDERVALDMDHIRQTLSQGASNKCDIVEVCMLMIFDLSAFIAFTGVLFSILSLPLRPPDRSASSSTELLLRTTSPRMTSHLRRI